MLQAQGKWSSQCREIVRRMARNDEKRLREALKKCFGPWIRGGTFSDLPVIHDHFDPKLVKTCCRIFLLLDAADGESSCRVDG